VHALRNPPTLRDRVHTGTKYRSPFGVRFSGGHWCAHVSQFALVCSRLILEFLARLCAPFVAQLAEQHRGCVGC
jgi:hypothetical protein